MLSTPAARTHHSPATAPDTPGGAVRPRQQQRSPRAVLGLVSACLPLCLMLGSCGTAPDTATAVRSPSSALTVMIPDGSQLADQFAALGRDRNGPAFNVTTYAGGPALEGRLKDDAPDVVILPAGTQARELALSGLLAPLDRSRIAAWSTLSTTLKRETSIGDGEAIHLVPLGTRPLGILYVPTGVRAPPVSFAQLFDRRRAGRVAVEDDAAATVMMAALALGHRDPLELSASDLRAVTAYLRANRTRIRSYWRSEAGLAEQLRSGAVVMAAGYPSTCVAALDLGVDVRFVLPSGPRLLRTDCIAVAATSDRQDGAYALIGRLLAPAAQTVLARAGWIGANAAALPALPETIRDAPWLTSARELGPALTIPPALERPAWVQAWYDARAKAG